MTAHIELMSPVHNMVYNGYCLNLVFSAWMYNCAPTDFFVKKI